jgi:hypothetical protein
MQDDFSGVDPSGQFFVQVPLLNSNPDEHFLHWISLLHSMHPSGHEKHVLFIRKYPLKHCKQFSSSQAVQNSRHKQIFSLSK